MNLTRTAYGTWNGGRFMHYGEALDDARFVALIRYAYERGIRSFMTADVYGNGAADQLLGQALKGYPRDSYCLIGAIGHDFYKGQREGSKGFPRFTNPTLRNPRDYADYLRMATEKVLERCQTDRLDLLLLHNPDSTGYGNDAVWNGLDRLREEGLTELLGVAPGPANGFTLDVIQCFERFGELIDWAMVILNPLEPWPGGLVLPAAKRFDIEVITRVVDYGGIFHDDVKPGHQFGAQDHRSFRPKGWVEAGNSKIEQLREIADRHGLTMLQFACTWNLAQPAVRSVIPTLIQEVGDSAKRIEAKVDELAALPHVTFTAQELATIAEVGNNKGCMALKGAHPGYAGEPVADQWPLRPELEEIGQRWGIDPRADLLQTH